MSRLPPLLIFITAAAALTGTVTSFNVPSATFIPSTFSPSHRIQSHVRLSAAATTGTTEKIEVEDFEEYARCMSPREVSFIYARQHQGHNNRRFLSHYLFPFMLYPTYVNVGTEAYPIRIERVRSHRRKT